MDQKVDLVCLQRSASGHTAWSNPRLCSTRRRSSSPAFPQRLERLTSKVDDQRIPDTKLLKNMSMSTVYVLFQMAHVCCMPVGGKKKKGQSKLWPSGERLMVDWTHRSSVDIRTMISVNNSVVASGYWKAIYRTVEFCPGISKFCKAHTVFNAWPGATNYGQLFQRLAENAILLVLQINKDPEKGSTPSRHKYRMMIYVAWSCLVDIWLILAKVINGILQHDMLE